MLILLKLIHHESFKSSVLSCYKVFVCLFNKIHIKLSKVLVCLLNKTCIKLLKNACLFIQQDMYQTIKECLFVYSTKHVLSCQRMQILLKLN